jgi:hypothetical protein
MALSLGRHKGSLRANFGAKMRDDSKMNSARHEFALDEDWFDGFMTSTTLRSQGRSEGQQ